MIVRVITINLWSSCYSIDRQDAPVKQAPHYADQGQVKGL